MEVRLNVAIQFAHGTVKNGAALHEKAPAMDPSCYWVRPRPTIHAILAKAFRGELCVSVQSSRMGQKPFGPVNDHKELKPRSDN